MTNKTGLYLTNYDSFDYSDRAGFTNNFGYMIDICLYAREMLPDVDLWTKRSRKNKSVDKYSS